MPFQNALFSHTPPLGPSDDVIRRFFCPRCQIRARPLRDGASRRARLGGTSAPLELATMREVRPPTDHPARLSRDLRPAIARRRPDSPTGALSDPFASPLRDRPETRTGSTRGRWSRGPPRCPPRPGPRRARVSESRDAEVRGVASLGSPLLREPPRRTRETCRAKKRRMRRMRRATDDVVLTTSS